MVKLDDLTLSLTFMYPWMGDLNCTALSNAAHIKPGR